MPAKLLIEIKGKKYSDGTEKTFYYSNSGITYNDIDYLPLIYGGILFSHSIDNENDGISVKLINNSKLDHLRQYAYSGREIKCHISREEDTDKFYLIFTGTIEQLLVGNTSVDIKAKSHYLAFETIANPELFTGVAGDLEGALEGTVKPRLFGKCFNIKPIYVDAPNLVLGISWKQDGTRDAIKAITELRNNGAPWSLKTSAVGSINGDFADAASLQAYIPSHAGGTYVTCLNEGLIKLGGDPHGTITIDVEQKDNTYEKFIALAVSETTVSAYYADGVIPTYAIGHYITAKTSYTALDAYFKNGLEVYSWFSAKAELVISSLSHSGVPEVFFVDDNKLPLKDNEIPIFKARALGRDKPPDTVDIEYQRNYHVQTDIAGAVTDTEKRVRFEQAVLLSSETIPDPFGLFPIKKDVLISTPLYDKADADLLKSLWVSIRKHVMDRFSITVPILSHTSRYVLGIIPQYSTGVVGDCITFDDTHHTFDSTKFSFDRAVDGCGVAFGNESLTVGSLVAITSKRFDLNAAKYIVRKIVINSREMSCTYELYGIRVVI